MGGLLQSAQGGGKGHLGRSAPSAAVSSALPAPQELRRGLLAVHLRLHGGCDAYSHWQGPTWNAHGLGGILTQFLIPGVVTVCSPTQSISIPWDLLGKEALRPAPGPWLGIPVSLMCDSHCATPRSLQCSQGHKHWLSSWVTHSGHPGSLSQMTNGRSPPWPEWSGGNPR